MAIELAQPAGPGKAGPEEDPSVEYILVSDKDLVILHSVRGLENAAGMRKFASVIRKAGGEVTIFKATKY